MSCSRAYLDCGCFDFVNVDIVIEIAVDTQAGTVDRISQDIASNAVDIKPSTVKALSKLPSLSWHIWRTDTKMESSKGPGKFASTFSSRLAGRKDVSSFLTRQLCKV